MADLAKDADQGTTVEWERYDNRATVFTDEPAIVRRLLRHPLFEPHDILKSDGESIAVKGSFPVAAMKFCSLARKQKGHSRVIAYDAEEKREWAKENLQSDRI